MAIRNLIRRTLAAGALAAIALLVYAVLGEPYRMTIREREIDAPALAEFFEDAVVVHISDLHTGGIGLREKRLVASLEEIDPDFVFITGDYVQNYAPRTNALDLLGRIPANEGRFGILGNVDYDGSRESCRLCHRPEGSDPAGPLRTGDPVRMLRNEVLLLERNGRRLQLIGCDEIDTNNSGPDGRVLLQSADRTLPLLVLSHTPYLIEEAEKAGVDLYLAGDTHGGQVAAPTALLRRIMPEKNWTYRNGLFRVGGTWLHVNHGIGWSIFPIRFGFPPEVTILRFTGEGER